MKSSTKRGDGKMKQAMNFNHVRAHFIKKGSSLTEWARKNGFTDQLVFYAVRGQRSGPTALRILEALKKELAA